MDEIIRAVSQDGYIKISAITARNAVQRAHEIHNTTPVATAALGRTLCAASILGDMLKGEDESLTIRISGGGPIGNIMAVSDSGGNIRGYVQNPGVDLPKRPDGKLNVGGAVGTDGMITVSRDLGLREPYVGSTALVSGEIAEDVSAYFVESEQVGAACGLGVLVDTDLSVRCAGGFLVQLLPGAPDELIQALEINIQNAGSVTGILDSGNGEDIISKILDGFQPVILDRVPISYKCYCSRDKVAEAVSSIGIQELSEIAQSEEDTVVTCQFCDIEYRFTPSDIAGLVRKIADKIKDEKE